MSFNNSNLFRWKINIILFYSVNINKISGAGYKNQNCNFSKNTLLNIRIFIFKYTYNFNFPYILFFLVVFIQDKIIVSNLSQNSHRLHSVSGLKDEDQGSLTLSCRDSVG